MLIEFIADPIFVPEAADGSRFLPDLRQATGFQIGPKGDERMIEDYEEALEELAHMKKPAWRRPSPTSNIRSVITGIRWVRIDRSTLDI